MMREIEAKLRTAVMSGVPLTLDESRAVLQMFELLHRIADNMEPNPAHQARNLLGHTR